MRRYRISIKFLSVGLIFATATALLYALFLGRARPLNSFLAAEGLFLLAAFLAWSFRSISLDDQHIVNTTFFVLTTKYPLLDVRRLQFERYGMTENLAVEFTHHPTLNLTNFDRSALTDVLRKIQKVRPDLAIPPDLL